MATNLFILVGAAILIYISCELFVNGVEWVGKRFGIAQSAVGSILAAIGTALPESIVKAEKIIKTKQLIDYPKAAGN